VSHLDQDIGQGDGVTVTFQLVKSYRSGAQIYARPIRKVVAGSVVVGVGGDPRPVTGDYVVDADRGLVTFAAPPDIGLRVTAGFEFDVPVRFDTDAVRVSVSSFNAGEVPGIPVLEIRT
jgi:uncharacterized protein (TIGR02217 family)